MQGDKVLPYTLLSPLLQSQSQYFIQSRAAKKPFSSLPDRNQISVLRVWLCGVGHQRSTFHQGGSYYPGDSKRLGGQCGFHRAETLPPSVSLQLS